MRCLMKPSWKSCENSLASEMQTFDMLSRMLSRRALRRTRPANSKSAHAAAPGRNSPRRRSTASASRPRRWLTQPHCASSASMASTTAAPELASGAGCDAKAGRTTPRTAAAALCSTARGGAGTGAAAPSSAPGSRSSATSEARKVSAAAPPPRAPPAAGETASENDATGADASAPLRQRSAASAQPLPAASDGGSRKPPFAAPAGVGRPSSSR